MAAFDKNHKEVTKLDIRIKAIQKINSFVVYYFENLNKPSKVLHVMYTAPNSFNTLRIENFYKILVRELGSVKERRFYACCHVV